jgi:hypothetical protein
MERVHRCGNCFLEGIRTSRAFRLGFRLTRSAQRQPGKLRNLQAIVLLGAFAQVGIERVIEDVFVGRSIEFLLANSTPLILNKQYLLKTIESKILVVGFGST